MAGGASITTAFVPSVTQVVQALEGKLGVSLFIGTVIGLGIAAGPVGLVVVPGVITTVVYDYEAGPNANVNDAIVAFKQGEEGADFFDLGREIGNLFGLT